MIADGKKRRYLAVKKVPALLRGITSNHNGDFYCLNCFNSYSRRNKLKKHGSVCNDHDYCHVEMPNEDNKILKYNHGEKLLKTLFMIYADSDCLLEKCICLKIIMKNFIQRKKKLSIRLLVTHCLQIVHLIQQKPNLIFTEVKILWKGFVRT